MQGRLKPLGKSTLGQRSDSVSAAKGTPHFDVGDIVKHERFGIGQVIEIEGSGAGEKARVKFEYNGEKCLLLKFAKMEKM
jgi:DNA helicase-2/ATP-dependent DNA helicase PcrA